MYVGLHQNLISGSSPVFPLVNSQSVCFCESSFDVSLSRREACVCACVSSISEQRVSGRVCLIPIQKPVSCLSLVISLSLLAIDANTYRPYKYPSHAHFVCKARQVAHNQHQMPVRVITHIVPDKNRSECD